MAFADLLVHEVDVYRRVEGVDRFGQPIGLNDPNGRELSATLPCRLNAARGGETFTDRSRDVVQATHELFLEPGADVRELDFVTVRDASGAVLLNEANVTLVRAQYRGVDDEHHREAMLLAIRESS